MELLPLAYTAAAQSCAAKAGQLVQYYSGAQQNFVESYFKWVGRGGQRAAVLHVGWADGLHE
jgi:hypothetical protein